MDGKWQVKQSQASLRKIDASEGSAVDQRVVDLVQVDHDATNQWLTSRSARSPHPQLRPALTTSAQLVSDAQRRYTEQLQQDGLPGRVLPDPPVAAPSVAAATASTTLPMAQGDISLRNVSDLYIYPNTLGGRGERGHRQGVAEMSAGQFNQIDTGKTGVSMERELPTYN